MKKQIDNIYIKRFFYFNLYVIKGKDGDILIDTGFIFMKKRIKKWLDKFNIKLVILTHAHVDHIWNANYIKELYSCEIALGKNDLKNLDNSIINSKPSNKKHNNWCKLMNYGMKKFKAKEFDVDILLTDKQIINKYGLNLKVIYLPGHTKGSIGILYNDYLFAGDALVNRGKYVTVAYQNQKNQNALKTYKKIKLLNPKLIFLGHDKYITSDKLKNKY